MRPESVHYVYLVGSEELIRRRLARRTGHFMNPKLLHSQFETLEAPDGVLAGAGKSLIDRSNGRTFVIAAAWSSVQPKSIWGMSVRGSLPASPSRIRAFLPDRTPQAPSESDAFR